MKKHLLRISLIVTLVALLAVVSAPAAASPAEGTTRDEFENWNINCSFVDQEGGVWVEDGILHVRGRVIYGYVLSDQDYHEGTALNVANANIDLVTGYGNYWGTLEFHPYAYPDGHWAGSYSMQVNEGRVGAIARLKGYGELEGWLTKSELMPLPPEFLEQNFSWVCEGSPPVSGVYATGIVMVPGGE